MDSIYDSPRKPPCQSLNNFQVSLDVPEISTIDNSFLNHKSQRDVEFNQSCLMKKHVRFENATQQPLISAASSNVNDFNLRKDNSPHDVFVRCPTLEGKTFEQIYMANVPDRHLDLSLLESSVQHCHKRVDKIDKTAALNRAILSPMSNHHSKKSVMCDNSMQQLSLAPAAAIRPNSSVKYLQSLEKNQVSPDFHRPFTSNEIAVTPDNSDQLTVKDLFKIIKQQNDQIMLLQKQVDSLRKNTQEPLLFRDDTNFQRSILKDFNSPKKGLSKFSFDVKTTSFEVSFKPQHHKVRPLQNENLAPRIQEINESNKALGNSLKDVGVSEDEVLLNLEESLHVEKSYVSAMSSIQINMDEYESTEEESSESEIGITFYQDIMGQINNVLKKIKNKSDCQLNKSKRFPASEVESLAIKRQPTAKNKELNLSTINESNEVALKETEGNDHPEGSFEIQQLLMKYLPNDKLTEVMSKNKQKPQKHRHNQQNPKFHPGTEFSFATLQYMEKYNILKSNKKVNAGQNKSSHRVLDISALKLQSKLI